MSNGDMTPIEWLLSSDTGVSSKTICAVMTGSKPARDSSPPQDPSDFGRCVRLLNAFPDWRYRMGEVAQKYPEWGPLIREWKDLELLYMVELLKKTGKASRLYKHMKELIDEGRIAAGWTRPAKGTWVSPTHTEFDLGFGKISIPHQP